MKKKKRKNCGDEREPFLCLVTGYKKFFDLKELKIKMFSVLNVSNGSSRPEELSIKDIEMLVDSEEQNWFLEGLRGELFRVSSHPHVNGKTSRRRSEHSGFLEG